MSAPKLAHDFFLSSGALQYFSFGDLLNIGKSTLEIAEAGIGGAWDKNPDTFRETGSSIGEGLGAVGMGMANLSFIKHSASRFGWGNSLFASGDSPIGKRLGIGTPVVHEAKSVLRKGGGAAIYTELQSGEHQLSGMLNKSGRFRKLAGPAMSGAAFNEMLGTGKAVSGVMKYTNTGAKFMKNLSFVGGIKPIAYAMAFGALAKGALGFAGGIIDESYNDLHKFQRIHYDSRFFNTELDQMTNYQTIGAAMGDSNRYLSIARSMHSR